MSVSIDTRIPWNQGAENISGWIALVVFLSFGIVLNTLQLLAHCIIPDLKRLHNSTAIVSLAIQDLIFDVLCLFTCSLSLRHHELFGHEWMCEFQGFYAELLMSSSGLTILSLILSSYAEFIHQHRLTINDIKWIQGAILLYSILLATLGAIGPGHAKLNSAGLFCYSATQDLLEGSIFFLGYVFPMFVGYIFMCWKISRRIRFLGTRIRRGTFTDVSITATIPRVAQQKNYDGMWWYAFVMFGCYVSIVGVAGYSWVTANHAPPAMWIAFGLSGHLNTLINPILYYVLSKPARNALLDFVLRSKQQAAYQVIGQSDLLLFFNYLMRTASGQAKLAEYAAVIYSTELTTFLFDIYPKWKAQLRVCTQSEVPRASSPTISLVIEKDSLSISPSSSPATTPEIELRTLYSKSTAPFLEGNQELQRITEEICDTYIHDDSPFRLNISYEMSRTISEKVETGQIDDKMFDKLIVELREMVFTEIFLQLNAKNALLAEQEQFQEEQKRLVEQ